MKNFPWIDKKISSIDLSNLSHALIVEGQEGVGKNQICQYLINGLLNEKNSKNLVKNNSHPCFSKKLKLRKAKINSKKYTCSD